MRLETTIAAAYWKQGGFWEGVREMGSNGIDGEKEYNAPLTITWRNNKLMFINEGASIPHEALLMGHSTKSDNKELIGQHGEGLKIGSLALLRAGHEVKIRSGSEVWIPKIEKSRNGFDAEVLVFYINKGRKDTNRVQVEIGGVDKEDWELMKPNFLRLNEGLEEAKGGYNGNVILDDALKGKIFVKGIFVQHCPDFGYGYNLLDADLDRDRRILDSYDLKWRVKSIWEEAIRSNNKLAKRFIPMLAEGKEDVRGFENSQYIHLDEAVIDQIAAYFRDEYGENAYPVENLGESEKLDHYGKRGIIVPGSLRGILEKKFGTFYSISEELKKKPKKTYGWHELSPETRESFNFAVELLAPFMQGLREVVDVVDFHQEDLRGTFCGGKIQLSHNILADKFETLRVLLHEVAHQDGGDGDKSHVSRMEQIWCELFRSLLPK